MRTEQLAVVQGWADTRATLRRWNRAPAGALAPWALTSLGVALAMLAGTWLVAVTVTPDPWSWPFPGVTGPDGLDAYGGILLRNALVLALHALACVAGFIAGSSLPVVAEGYRGVWGWIHRKAGPLAIAFVGAATLFSLATQTFALGQGAASIAASLELSPAELLLLLTPHALPELIALFLPLAAWMLASRRGRWDELLAATFVTVAVAVPVLLTTAAVEVWVTPRLLAAAT
jgi:hypothetical protein